MSQCGHPYQRPDESLIGAGLLPQEVPSCKLCTMSGCACGWKHKMRQLDAYTVCYTTSPGQNHGRLDEPASTAPGLTMKKPSGLPHATNHACLVWKRAGSHRSGWCCRNFKWGHIVPACPSQKHHLTRPRLDACLRYEMKLRRCTS